MGRPAAESDERNRFTEVQAGHLYLVRKDSQQLQESDDSRAMPEVRSADPERFRLFSYALRSMLARVLLDLLGKLHVQTRPRHGKVL